MRCAQSGLLKPAEDVHHSHMPQGITQGVVKVPLGPRCDSAEIRFDFGPHLLDWSVVGAVRWQG